MVRSRRFDHDFAVDVMAVVFVMRSWRRRHPATRYTTARHAGTRKIATPYRLAMGWTDRQRRVVERIAAGVAIAKVFGVALFSRPVSVHPIQVVVVPFSFAVAAGTGVDRVVGSTEIMAPRVARDRPAGRWTVERPDWATAKFATELSLTRLGGHHEQDQRSGE